MSTRKAKSWTHYKKKPAKPFEGAVHHSANVHNSARWRGLRKKYITQFPLCIECKKRGHIKAGDLVDHIIAIADGGPEWDWANLQSLCFQHHSKKTNQEINKRKKLLY